MTPSARLHGVAAEFDSPESLLAAARALSGDGYTKMDAFTPFPVHGLDKRWPRPLAVGVPGLWGGPGGDGRGRSNGGRAPWIPR
jgi:hypothetical protein